MTARPATTTGGRAREVNLYRRYFDLIAAGYKTIEIRVEYPKLRRLAAGDHIRFVCGRDDTLTVVKRVTRYRSFEEMLDGEGPEKVDPGSPRDQQLASIRRIYGPAKEALGVLAIEVELLRSATRLLQWPDRRFLQGAERYASCGYRDRQDHGVTGSQGAAKPLRELLIRAGLHLEHQAPVLAVVRSLEQLVPPLSRVLSQFADHGLDHCFVRRCLCPKRYTWQGCRPQPAALEIHPDIVASTEVCGEVSPGRRGVLA
jgi:ASC-1-like (ASCH) protein